MDGSWFVPHFWLISQQLWDGLPWNLTQTSRYMVLRRWLTLTSPDFSSAATIFSFFFLWNILATTGETAIKFNTDMKYNDLMTFLTSHLGLSSRQILFFFFSKYLKILISLTCALCLEHRCINEIWIQHQRQGPVNDYENFRILCIASALCVSKVSHFTAVPLKNWYLSQYKIVFLCITEQFSHYVKICVAHFSDN